MSAGTTERKTVVAGDDALAAEVRREIVLSREGMRAEAERVMEAACALAEAAAERGIR